MLGSIKSNCGAMGTPYTGLGNCPKKEGKVSALLITGKNALYPMESEDFVSGLSGHVTTADALKMYPIKGVVGMTINGGEVNAPDLGTYGGPVPTNLTAKELSPTRSMRATASTKRFRSSTNAEMRVRAGRRRRVRVRYRSGARRQELLCRFRGYALRGADPDRRLDGLQPFAVRLLHAFQRVGGEEHAAPSRWACPTCRTA
ncbi:MAG: hypothetical protein ACLR8Y_04180 [Alistipes indistinctus]